LILGFRPRFVGQAVRDQRRRGVSAIKPFPSLKDCLHERRLQQKCAQNGRDYDFRMAYHRQAALPNWTDKTWAEFSTLEGTELLQ
jgi:hypothetical protein